MYAGHWKSLLITFATCAVLASPVLDDLAYGGQGRGRGQQSGGESRGKGQALVPQGRGAGQAGGRQGAAFNRPVPRGYQEPAFARGYGDGYQRGLADGKARNRYDPVDSPDYRNGDQGYSNAYGSRDAYRSNYRAGFRQGYEEGYREATR
jgi:hypothetical protein